MADEASRDPAEFRVRARRLLEDVPGLIDRGEYDRAAYYVAEYVRLSLTARILEVTGGLVDSYSLVGLAATLAEHDPSAKRLVEDPDVLVELSRIERVFVVSRFGGGGFTEDETRRLYEFVKRALSPVLGT
ncbi:MAG: HEPN domain-containing protein [Thermogladius sp.]